MNINDETLSAYLDNELSEQDRARVDADLSNNTNVADRLAQLASVNALIGRQAALIDQLPIPDSVLNMLSESSSSVTASKVVDLSLFRRVLSRTKQLVRENTALAASLALLVGFASGQLLPTTKGNDDTNTAIYAALDSALSGQQLLIDTNTSLTARFSFRDTQARFCRQYMVQDSLSNTENIACRDQNEWTLVASVRSSAIASSTQYQPASGPRLLDNMLDAMMLGSTLSQTEEQTAINNQWQPE